MGSGSLSDLFTIGVDNIVVDLDEMFPALPPGNIYVALTGGIESTLVLYLLIEKYSASRVIACTYRFGDRRAWEFGNAKAMAERLGVKHVEAGYLANSIGMAEQLPTPIAYFNRENGVFDNVRKMDPSFVAGFTGKNTTELDPEVVTREEQEKYLVWYNVHRPLLATDKHHSIDLLVKLGAEELLKYTHTCQRGGRGNACGECHACFERVDAFDRLGMKDPAIYKQDYELIVSNVRKFFKQYRLNLEKGSK